MIWLIIACSEYDLKGEVETEDVFEDTGEVSTEPDIVVDPVVLSFSAVTIGESASEVVTVENVGDATLTLDEVTIDVPFPFTVTNLAGDTLEPGDLGVLTVDYDPAEAGPFTGVLTVHSDDPDEPEVEVDLLAETTGPAVSLTPASHDYGDVEARTEDTLTLILANLGDADLTIDSWSYTSTSNAELYVTDAGGLLPGDLLAPGDEIEILVTFAPENEGQEEGTFIVLCDDPDTPEVSATQEGNGTAPSVVEYEVEITLTADDAWEGYLNGAATKVSTDASWNSASSMAYTLESGEHVLAVHAWDQASVISGFISVVYVDGTPEVVTGDGSWLMTASDPGSGWEDPAFDDSGWSTAIPCTDISTWGSSLSTLYSDGATWVWWTSSCTSLGEAWFRLHLELD